MNKDKTKEKHGKKKGVNKVTENKLDAKEIVHDYYEYLHKDKDSIVLDNRDMVNEYILKIMKNKDDFSLFFIDLDNFDIINNTLRYNWGNEIIVNVTNTLYSVVSNTKGLILGKLGGNEFIIIRKGNNDLNKIKDLAQEIIDIVENDEKLRVYDYKTSISIGISLSSEKYSEDHRLLQYSNIAMAHSKNNGGGRYSIFNNEMLQSLKMEKKIKEAVKNKKFELYLQEVHDVKGDKNKGFEALVRWFDKDEVIYPDEFISIAKKTGDIIKIDQFMFKEVVKTVREFLNDGMNDFYISINTSKLFLKQKDIITFISNELKIHNVESKYIKFEVTEDDIIENLENAVSILNNLRNIGIEIFLDDFGEGYSSFHHIKYLPINVIKLDRSLIIDIENDIRAREIVKTILILADKLHVDTICEGAESIEQVNILKKIGASNIQGYYFGRPKPKNYFFTYKVS